MKRKHNKTKLRFTMQRCVSFVPWILRSYGLSLVVSSALTVTSLSAQMVSPEMDHLGEPFSYFSQPTGEIGMMYADAATEITPEGYLRTGYGELMFFAGMDLAPIAARTRTLEQGHLPIQHFSIVRDGVRYEFSLLAATLDGKPEGTQVNFVRVTLTNENTLPTRAFFATGIRYDAPRSASISHGDNRFDRPVEGRFPGDYRQIGEAFNADWTYSFTGSRFLRDERILYFFPQTVDRSYTIHGFYNYPVATDKPTKLNILQDTATGIARYTPLLKPGESHVLEFKMPVRPTTGAAEASAIEKMSYAQAEAQTIAFWNKVLHQGMEIELPEAKAVDTFDASLIYDLIAIDHLNDNYIQTVNKLHYHAFFLRDTSDIVQMYDLTGYPEIAGQVLAFFAKSQHADGNFLSQEQQYDGWGEALWTYGQHYRMTHDRAFAEDALPRIDRAVDWLIAARAKDSLHIMPASDVRDDENVPGHLTGYNFLALSGLKVAIAMAEDTHHTDLAARWRKEYNSYRTSFLAVLDRETAATGGYIPPALDGQKDGYDWGNLLAVVPEPTLDPFDPRVTATLKATQAKYQEGIMTYANGAFLHHYLTIKNTLTEVERGEQQQALREFYALLLHTGSDHAGFEFAIHPWGDRNFSDNLAPHGWFAAEYRTLLRKMLVREQDRQLHLLSVFSPEWIGAGKVVAVRQVPTSYGEVAFRLEQPESGRAILHLDTHYTNVPAALVLHLPWFMTLTHAEADGEEVTAQNGVLTLPASAREVTLQWARAANTPTMSYAQTVADYRAEYRKRYDAFLHEK
jgi:hypothetical protein